MHQTFPSLHQVSSFPLAIFFRKQHVISRPSGAFRFSLLTCYAHSTWRCVQCEFRSGAGNSRGMTDSERAILGAFSPSPPKEWQWNNTPRFLETGCMQASWDGGRNYYSLFSKPNRILWHSREISEEVANPANCIFRWAISTVRTEVVSPLLWHCSLNAQHRKKVFYGTSF